MVGRGLLRMLVGTCYVCLGNARYGSWVGPVNSWAWFVIYDICVFLVARR